MYGLYAYAGPHREDERLREATPEERVRFDETGQTEIFADGFWCFVTEDSNAGEAVL